MRLMANLPRETEYRISKHVEFKPGEGEGRPVRKWISLAAPLDDFDTFDQNLESSIAIGKKNTVFVENVVNQFRGKDELLDLLKEHVTFNMVKIGKKLYRQKKGIPQGSVVSSLLCNYFYADLEAQHLGFLSVGNGESLLLRLIDDFLLITTNRGHAKRFLQVMHDGLQEYGVTVNRSKTLANFEATINNLKVPRLVGQSQFPYCGTFIDTHTLNITKDRERRKEITTSVSDSLTVEYSRVPGATFQRKVLNAFKIQAHAMFLDTSFNSLATVFSNLYDSFTETAMKMWTYAKCFPSVKRPGASLVIRTIEALVELADVLLRSKRKGNIGYRCAVTKGQIEWLAFTSFRDVLGRRQSGYRVVIEWLERRIEVLKNRKGNDCIAFKQQL
jgi:telomerase reverse transcriptase